MHRSHAADAGARPAATVPACRAGAGFRALTVGNALAFATLACALALAACEADPNPMTTGGGNSGPAMIEAFRVDTAAALAGAVEVTFSAPPVSAAALSPSSYCFARVADPDCSEPKLAVGTVSRTATPLTYRVGTSTMVGSVGYRVHVSGVARAADGAGLSTATADFSGYFHEPQDVPVGAVILSEVLAAPAGPGSERAAGQYLELYNAGPVAVSLLGMKVETSAATLLRALVLQPGDYLAICGAAAFAELGIARCASDGLTGALDEAGGTVRLSYNGRTLDSAVYPASMAGHALELGSAALNAAANDDSTRWCDGVRPTGTGSFGTPGMPNDCGY